jgi:hypothetical protein
VSNSKGLKPNIFAMKKESNLEIEKIFFFPKSLLATITAFILFSCSNIGTKTIQIGENTFVHNEKVYRIIDNEITELGDLNSTSIPKSAVLDPKLNSFGKNEMDFVREGVSTELEAVYRGDVLYYRLELKGLNDLRDKYSGGGFSINFLDEFGFQIHSFDLEMTELIRIIGSNNQTMYFEYNGKTQMSSEVYQAISRYSVSSSLREKSQYGW